MEIKKYINKIVSNGNNEDMEKLSNMLVDLMYKIKEYNENEFHEEKIKLYEIAYGKVLTEDMAKEIVTNMMPYGEYWDMETTTTAKNQFGIKNISDIDFYVVMNKSYNDNKDTVDKFITDNDKKLQMYVSLTNDFVNDIDAKEGKVYTYFMIIPK